MNKITKFANAFFIILGAFMFSSFLTKLTRFTSDTSLDQAVALAEDVNMLSNAYALTPPKSATDFFVYSQPDGYGALVDAVDGLPTPDKWRRELSSMYTAPCTGGYTYRLYVRGALFPGRCFICKRNNKSLSHCIIGQGAKSGNGVATETTLKLRKFVYKAEQMVAENGIGNTTTADVFVFPHETDIADPKKIHRVSQQHSFPAIDPLLRQEPFASYFSPETFKPLFQNPIVVSSKTRAARRLGRSWTEPEKKFRAREKKFIMALANPDDRVRRGQAASAISECYLSLVNMHCGETCEKISEKRKGVVLIKTECEECRHVQRALKKHFIDTMTKTVNGVINKLFVQRAGPFVGCPLLLVGDRHVDADCRVERIIEAKP